LQEPTGGSIVNILPNSNPSHDGRTAMDVDLTALAAKFGSDKGNTLGDWGVAHNYTAVYQALLATRRLEALRILELGVWKGASLQMWESFFPNAQIIGVEILPNIVTAQLQRANVVIGDATDRGFLRDLIGRFRGGKVDIVIDDASHVLEQQILSFETLFPALDEGGIYFVEDISGSRYKDGNRGTMPFQDFLDYAWCLAQQTTFFPRTLTKTYHNIKDVRSLSDYERAALAISYWNENLHGVSTFHDLCVFQKRKRHVTAEIAERSLVLRPGSGVAYEANSLRGRPSQREEQHTAANTFVHSIHAVIERTRDLRDEIEMLTGTSPIGEIPPFVTLAHHRKVRKLLERVEMLFLQVHSQLECSEARESALLKKTNHVESEQVRVTTDLSKVRSENESLSAQVSSLNHEIGRWQAFAAQAQVSREELPTLRAELERQRKCATEIEQQYEKICSENEVLSTQAATLNREIKQWQAGAAQAEISREELPTLRELATEHKERCEVLEQELAAQREYAARTLSKTWETILNLQAEREAQSAIVTALQQQVNDLRHERSQFLRSTSWRVTAPLRALGILLRRKGNVARSAL
jgi:23S rRNA U2552 (ribose-2'-O)-methylase RlmE/FtsJ